MAWKRRREVSVRSPCRPDGLLDDFVGSGLDILILLGLHSQNSSQGFGSCVVHASTTVHSVNTAFNGATFGSGGDSTKSPGKRYPVPLIPVVDDRRFLSLESGKIACDNFKWVSLLEVLSNG